MEELHSSSGSSGAAPKQSENIYLIPASIITAGVIVAVAVIYAFSPRGIERTPSADTRGSGAAPETISVEELLDDDPALGSASAPLTLIEFGDFQCPFCKKFHDEARREIITRYVNTGRVRVVYRDFPIEGIHPFARPAAEAAECADEQGKFWQYHDALYSRQSELGTMSYVALAAELGLNRSTFSDCVTARTYRDEVTKDYDDGVRAGVTGTPAFLIVKGDAVVGEIIAGAQPLRTFQAAIDSALSE